ncbi:MAG: Na/Pi cotransporter family protein [Candidatus Gastranaerophilales bacterium]|nr:Na/Pi cotransporter family protein [Candidatus Gastranaerophilales bacterium]
MDIFSIFTLCGGLAFFLYGISEMSAGLEKIAGGKLELILKKMTSNPFKSFALGAVITALIQSSSAVTVMLVGLVNSGIMNLSQTVSVIIGANVGTTMTAWILSLAGIKGTSAGVFLKCLNPEVFSPLLALAGIILIMTSKSVKRKSVGSVFMGFAILMFGMIVMADSMAPLADMPAFQKTLIAFSNPLLSMLIGLVVTMIIQSSSASIGILQALSLTVGIPYQMAIPIILGQNLGTCISAALSAIGVNTNAKRVAAVHVIYNIICVGLALPLFMLGNWLFDIPFLTNNVTPFSIAVTHTIYNIITAFAFFPFFKFLEKAAVWAVPEKSSSNKQQVILDERLMLAPSFAISECYRQTVKMAEMVEFNFTGSTKMLKSFHQKKAEQIEENETTIDTYEDKLSSFLIKLSGKELSEDDNNRISQLLLAIGDYERIGDHTSHILNLAQRINESEHKLSDDAVKELKVIVDAVSEIFNLAFEAYKTDNIRLAQEIEPLESVIKKIIRNVKNRHIQRLKDGLCTPELSFMFSDLLADFRRIAAHCGNIAISVIQLKDVNLGKHEYNHRNKEDDSEYNSKYKDYKSRYNVPKVETESDSTNPIQT